VILDGPRALCAAPGERRWERSVLEKWKKLGSWLGSHMSLIAPVCVAAGVLLPEVFSVTEQAVPLLFAVMTFQGSLNNNFKSVAAQFRHPVDVLFILAVSLVLMPVGAHALASVLFAGSDNLITGATLEYCVPVGVVSFMWCGMYDGDLSLGLAAILISTVLAPFTIPLTLKLLLGATVEVDVLGMMENMVFMIALPAVLGMVVNDLTHGWGHKELSPVMAPASKILLIIIIASNSSQMSDYMRHLTPELLAMALFILLYASAGFAVGLLIGRLRGLWRGKLVTSCFCTGIRNISAGAVLAAEFFPGEVVFPVMMGTLFQQILAGIFGSVINRIAPADESKTA
jgi:bile acid:Na+ symporter, BASS family